MKHTRLSGFFAPGFLAFLLQGCFNPAAPSAPVSGNPAAPFAVDVVIGATADAGADAGANAGAQGRALAGPGADRIKGTAGESIRNSIQLVVVEKESGAVTHVAEQRRERDDETYAVLTINDIPYGKTYEFLILMGYWDRSGVNDDGTYAYDEGTPPTLLAAGLQEQKIVGSTTVRVTMWPLVVDTEFTAPSRSVPAKTGAAAALPPVAWNVKWTVQTGAGGNGLADLIAAQKNIAAGGAGNGLRITGKTIRVNGTAVRSETNASTGNVITHDITDYTAGLAKIGTSGSAAFTLEYVPFNLAAKEDWEDFADKSIFDLNNGPPVWIIRNGVNDEVQDEDTDFSGPWWETGKNGNGAVRFALTEEKDGSLVIGLPAARDDAAITFTTGGYAGTADVYYAAAPVVNGGTVAPADYSAYTLLGSYGTGTHTAEITIAEAADVYLMVFKDGKTGDGSFKIPTTAAQIWGNPADCLVEGAAGMTSIKDKFGITAEGSEGVAETFKTLHRFIQAGGLGPDIEGTIQPGDWIDLESLTVDGYNAEEYSNPDGGFAVTNTVFSGDKGALLRLIAVGINSFRSGRGQYTVEDNDGVDHVVFQFQNIPVARRMNATDDTSGGYAASEMRKYLTPVGGDPRSGRFLAGLVAAGVPEDVMWAPVRHISVRGAGGTVQDLLWLPTEREMFGAGTHSEAGYETPENQARLEYYFDAARRKKYMGTVFASGSPYWTASPNSSHFTYVDSAGSAFFSNAGGMSGCAPAFCID
ncbi:MAG: hypothetical protein LBE17_14655 [Treponema sp.]|jgi:hypothetical protein|nr:hypothetical protein [Treponema sp.]